MCMQSCQVFIHRLCLSHMQDPSVMNAALCALHEVVARTPQPYKNLIPSFVSILKQARLACHTSLP